MNDFFSRLANRAVVPSPAVRPQLLSVYESSPVSVDRSLLEETVELPVNPLPVQEPRRKTRIDPEEAAVANPPSGEPVERKTAPLLAANPPSRDRPNPVEKEVGSSDRVARRNEPGQMIEPHKPDIKVAVVREENYRPAHSEQPAALSTTPIPREERPGPRSSDSGDVVTPKKGAGRVIEARTVTIERKSPEQPQLTKPAATLPTAPPLPHRPAAPSLLPWVVPMPRAERSPPPAVHVTIGRVEIRALTPPAAEPRSNRAAPRLSLDEYLKRNAGATP